MTEVDVKDNLITLTRVIQEEDGSYSSTENDQIVNNVADDRGYNSSEVVVTQNYQKIVQLVLRNTMDIKKPKNTKPLMVMFEGSRELAVEIPNPVRRLRRYLSCASST